MSYQIPITDSDIQAYCDGQLSASRQHEVEQYLLDNPVAARQVEVCRQMNTMIHMLYDPALDEPIPVQLEVNNRRYSKKPYLLRAAAVFAWLILGTVIGWQLNPAIKIPPSEDMFAMHLVQPAVMAHTIYSSEVRHPVEVTAEQEQHLVKWLSKRMNIPVKAVNLSKQGYELMGGRLLPSTDRMAAQFMYERSDGARITLYVRQGAWENKFTSFQYQRRGNSAIFYWIDGPVGYALVGEMNKKDLLALSKNIYHQLN